MAYRTVAGVVQRRVGDGPAWSLLIQLFLGLGWLRAAVEKVPSGRWWSGAEIRNFVWANETHAVGWYEPVFDLVVRPHTFTIAIIVVVLQLGAAASLLTGRRLGVGLAGGLFLNANFVAAGAVNPSAFYILGQLAVVLWLVEQRRLTARFRQWLVLARGAAVVIGALSVPFVRTLAPSEVIDDPAMMFVTFAALMLVVSITLSRPSLTTDRSFSGPAVDEHRARVLVGSPR